VLIVIAIVPQLGVLIVTKCPKITGAKYPNSSLWGILGQLISLILPPLQDWFHEFYLDVSSLIVTTSAFVKKKNSKMRHLKKFVKPMEVNRTCISFTNFL
jgi:hypothetical protein